MPARGLRESIRFYLVDCTTPLGKAIDIGLIVLNLLTCALYGIGTYIEDANATLAKTINMAEWICVTIFIVEYLLRFYAAERKLRHFFSLYALIDLISILPVFSTVMDLRFLRAARIFRIFRFFRFLQDEDFFFGQVSRTQIQVLRLAMTATAIIFVASGCIYEAESGANPEQFQTLGDAAYFAIVTVTTVGFGDQTPITDAGRLVTALMIIAGVVSIPYHIGQLARQVFFDASLKKEPCPSCALNRHEHDAHYCRRCGSKLQNAPSTNT
ncbi:MAG: potassium channel family protein [Planctomycetota bacterium]|jgi:voltage-gated potassium channel